LVVLIDIINIISTFIIISDVLNNIFIDAILIFEGCPFFGIDLNRFNPFGSIDCLFGFDLLVIPLLVINLYFRLKEKKPQTNF